MTNGRTPNTNCHRCQDPMYLRPSQMARQEKWHCSMTCHNKAKCPRTPFTCSFAPCGKEFLPSRTSSRGSPKFCSRTCSNYGRTGTKYKTMPDPLDPRQHVSKNVYRRGVCIQRDGDRCSECGLDPEWNGLSLVLQVDHIDGDNRNNEHSNWRLLCPNCHSQTPTFAGRNHGRYSS